MGAGGFVGLGGDGLAGALGFGEQLGDAGEVVAEHLQQRGLAQGGGGVIDGVDQPVAGLGRDAAGAAHRGAGDEVLGGEAAEGDDQLGADAGDLLAEVGLAGGDLVGLRVAVLGRAALDDVGDEDLGAGQPDAVEEVVEQFAGLSDEGAALLVFVEAGAFADEHQLGVGVAVAGNGAVASLAEAAGVAACDAVVEGEQLVAVHGLSLWGRRGSRHAGGADCAARVLGIHNDAATCRERVLDSRRALAGERGEESLRWVCSTDGRRW